MKSMPTVGGVALQRVPLVNFRKAVAPHHHDGEHLHRARRRDRVRSGLQQRPDFAVRTRP